jgi:pSer/pThr/pTyr-binding forkhead associated (FHA) protein
LPATRFFGPTTARQLASSRLRRAASELQDNFIAFATDRSSGEAPSMSSRFVAVDEGPEISLDRAMIVVGRHPDCDTRLNSLRVSRHHCCMTRESDHVVVRDLGSTNGIRINGIQVETGSVRLGDELSIAHIRYRLEGEEDSEQASDPAIREQDSTPDSSQPWNWIQSPKWCFGPMHKG